MEGDWGKWWAEYKKQRHLQKALPFLFPAFALFSLPSSPSLFAPATQAVGSLGHLIPKGCALQFLEEPIHIASVLEQLIFKPETILAYQRT